jgi:membrane protein DedA with SNARE-associated domain
MTLEAFLERHGLIAVVCLATVEGDLTLILAGVVAHLGLFGLPAAMLAGMIGNLLGDCAWFGLGRFRSAHFKRSRIYARVGPAVERLARRLGVWQLLAARAIYGTRNASMVFWGLHGLPFGRFLAVDLLGCAIWSVLFATLGYVLSGSAARLIGNVKRVELWLLGAVVVGAICVAIVTRIMKREVHADEP